MTIGATITIRPSYDMDGNESDILGNVSGRIIGIFGEDVEVELLGAIDLDGYKTTEVCVNFRRIKLG
jgi:hypothetical protein